MTTEVKKPEEWETEFGIIIIDPDGWRPSSPYGLKAWTEPITKYEFRQRMHISTIRGNPNA